MSEKIKGMIGSRTRGADVLKWLKSQGADCIIGNGGIYNGESEEVIYYVDNNEIKIINKRHSVLFDLVELPRWRALEGDRYYYVSDRGHVSTAKETGVADDNCRYKIGNYFETFKEAEPYAKKVREIFKVIIENAEETR